MRFFYALSTSPSFWPKKNTYLIINTKNLISKPKSATTFTNNSADGLNLMMEVFYITKKKRKWQIKYTCQNSKNKQNCSFYGRENCLDQNYHKEAIVSRYN